jgi:hypothetical protein
MSDPALRTKWRKDYTRPPNLNTQSIYKSYQIIGNIIRYYGYLAYSPNIIYIDNRRKVITTSQFIFRIISITTPMAYITLMDTEV